MNDALRTIANDSLCLTEAPYLRHYQRGRFQLWNNVAFTGSCMPGPGFNFAAVLGPTPSLDEILPVARDFFSDADKGWGILVEADAGHPVEAEMRSRGWVIDEDEPAYVMERIESQPPGPPELRIEHVNTEPAEAAYHAVLNLAFAPPPELAAIMKPSISYVGAADIHLFLGVFEGANVAVSGYSMCGSTAVVWGVATLEAYRGRGFGAAITRAALTHAAARGCTSASLRSGPKSRPLYERLGFQYVCNHRTYAAPKI